MNVTVYTESYAWLFDERPRHQSCLWSFGRHRPPVEVGEDLLFLDAGQPVGRAIVRAIHAPGVCDVPMHDGSRVLTGWKTQWMQGDFEDLRHLLLPPAFARPLSEHMLEALHAAASDRWGRADGYIRNGRTIMRLLERKLLEYSSIGVTLTAEGWRAVRREISPARVADIAAGRCCCRICGCTSSHACDEGCEWVTPNLCSVCMRLIHPMRRELMGGDRL